MIDPAEREVLRLYSRPVAHMFRQLNDGRLGLVLGAGIHKALGCPDWRELVARISAHPDVAGSVFRRDTDDTPLPILAQILFQHFRRRSTPAGGNGYEEREHHRIAAAEFRSIIHQCLYQDVPADDEELMEKDNFYCHYEKVIKRSPMTVTYNFDDSLERILLAGRTPAERQRSRGFETVTDARLQFRAPTGIVYHPNGYLPRSPLEAPAEALVFSEDSFADQLIDTMAGHFSSLLHHLSKNTCLLVGISLDDATLRHLLRQNAKINPGHYHYYVHYVHPEEGPDVEERRARRDANFEVFNLITLFLDQEMVGALGRLLSQPFVELRAKAAEAGATVSYCYYLTGVPGVGKTTTSSYFKSLVTYDEWLERRLPEMGRPHVELSQQEREKVDSWVREQIGLKNRRLIDDEREKGVGITMVDRCIPDAIAFSEDRGWQKKAGALLDAISPGESNRTVHSGQVLLLEGDPRELAIRSKCRGKEAPADYISRLQEDTRRIYSEGGVFRLTTTGRSVFEVVKDVARVVHMDDYSPCDLHTLLSRFANGVEE